MGENKWSYRQFLTIMQVQSFSYCDWGAAVRRGVIGGDANGES